LVTENGENGPRSSFLDRRPPSARVVPFERFDRSCVVHDGFISEVVTSTKAMSGSFMPNPRNGNKPMMILDSIEIMDLSKGPKVCTNGERGLHSVIPSLTKNVTETRHVFAFFTKYKEYCLDDPGDCPHTVVMRFSMDPETLMLDYDEGTLMFRGA